MTTRTISDRCGFEFESIDGRFNFHRGTFTYERKSETGILSKKNVQTGLDT